MWLTAMKRKRAARIGQAVLPYLSQGARMIDIGCGKGYTTEYLRGESKADIIGVDVINKLEVPLPFVLYDGVKLPFKDKEYDLGLFIFVLHHATDKLQLLSEARRVFRKVLVIEDVYTTIPGYLFTVVMDFLLNQGKGSVRFKTKEEWKEIFSEYGFLLLEMKEIRLGIFGPSRHCLFLLQSAA